MALFVLDASVAISWCFPGDPTENTPYSRGILNRLAGDDAIVPEIWAFEIANSIFVSYTADRVDLEDGLLIIESLKKRRKGVYRAIPVPPSFLETLEAVHNLKAVRSGPDSGRNVYLWPWSRPTGWRYVCAVMDAAGIAGLHATPKGLRHGFGIKAVVSNVPLNMTQKWLGHAQLATTAIYADATGPEEKQLAERMWS